MRDPRSPHAARRRARDRRYRARKARCAAVALVEFDDRMLSFLIATAWLDDREAHDARKVGAAISRLLADAARR